MYDIPMCQQHVISQDFRSLHQPSPISHRGSCQVVASIRQTRRHFPLQLVYQLRCHPGIKILSRMIQMQCIKALCVVCMHGKNVVITEQLCTITVNYD